MHYLAYFSIFNKVFHAVVGGHPPPLLYKRAILFIIIQTTQHPIIMSKRTSHQKDCSEKYTGDNKTNASHVISVKEKEYFNLPKSNDSPANYRNQNAATNQSVHTTIDNHLVNNSPNHTIEGGINSFSIFIFLIFFFFFVIIYDFVSSFFFFFTL